MRTSLNRIITKFSMLQGFRETLPLSILVVGLMSASCNSSESKQKYKSESASSTFREANEDLWYVGKWKGKLNTKMHEEYIIRIRGDGTCSIKSEWFWGDVRSADFDAEWESISDDIIKIFDYDGHNENWNGFNGINQRRVGRWSMYLKSNGAFNHDLPGLNTPDGYLEKQ